MSVSANSQPCVHQWQLATEEPEKATALGQSSPFVGILSKDERLNLMLDWSDTHGQVKRSSIERALVTIANYPIIATLTSKITPATRLDGRACRYIYLSGLSTIDAALIHPEEMAFMRALGVDHPGHENLVVVTSEGDDLVLRLSGGRELRHEDAETLADLLLATGVTAADVRMPDWRAEGTAPCTGYKIAILGRMTLQSTKQVGAG